MNAEGRSDGDRGLKQGKVTDSLLKGRSALLVGLLVSVLVVSPLFVGGASAADRVIDVSCEVCGEAADPVQYSFMARLMDRAAILAREAEIARLRGLAGLGAGSRARVDEVVHLRGLAEAARSSTAARLAREAEIARLRGLTGPGAGSLSRVDEVVHLRGLEAARSGAAASLAREAEIARLRGLSGPGAGSSVRFDEVVHLRGLVEAARSSAAAEDCC
jgi:hypothetical protein